MVFEAALLADIKDLVGGANAGVLLDVGPRCSRGAHDAQAPIGHAGGKNCVATGYGFELEVFRPDGNTVVLLDERARRNRTARDIPRSEERRVGKEGIAAWGRDCESKNIHI